MYHYCYVTTNLITGKKYVGDHSTNDIEKDKYLGSGTLVKKKIKEYGRENFKKEILEFFETKSEAYFAQEKYIIEYDSLVPTGYNINKKGGYNVMGIYTGKTFSEEHKKNISNARKGKPHPHKGHIITEEIKEKIRLGNLGKTSPFKGKKHSEESKQKISIKNKNNSGFKGKQHSEESKQKIRNSINNKGSNNGMYNKQHSDDSKEKMKLQQRNRTKKICPHCNIKMDPGNYGKYHGSKCKSLFN